MLNVRRPVEVLREALVFDTGQRKLVAVHVVRLRLAGRSFKEETQHLQLTCVLPGGAQTYVWVGDTAAKRLAAELETKEDHTFLIDTTRRADTCIVGVLDTDDVFAPPSLARVICERTANSSSRA